MYLFLTVNQSGAQEKKPRKKQEPSLQDKSTVPRMLTIDIKSVKEINVKKKDIFALYEIYGRLPGAFYAKLPLTYQRILLFRIRVSKSLVNNFLLLFPCSHAACCRKVMLYSQ